MIWMETSYTFKAGDHFIWDEVSRITQARVFIPAGTDSSSVMSGETDAVDTYIWGNSFANFPSNFELYNPTRYNSSFGTADAEEQQSWAQEQSPDLLTNLWHQTRSLVNKADLYSCRIAIEEHGLLYIVPLATQIYDLVCTFPQSDTVAIVRKSGTEGQIVGRAVSYLVHPPTSPLRAFERYGWPSLHQVPPNPVEFELDIDMLQILTRASSRPDNPP